MRLDSRGLTVTTDSDIALRNVDTFAGELISHGQRADCILRAVEADADCGMAQACAGALFMFLHTRAGFERARPYVEAAQQQINNVTERERLFIQGVVHWYEHDLTAAIACHEQISKHWPEDLLSAKMGQIHQLSIGAARGMHSMARRVLDANPKNPHAMGMLAFAEEQIGDYAQAERRGRAAVELEEFVDPWSQHAVAHVLKAQNRAADGINWLASHADSWDRCSSFMYTHNWWHLALFYLDAGQYADAIQLYDQQVWTKRKEHVHDQINAVSLLLRLECRGVDVGDRWGEVASYAKLNTADQLNGFVDLHMLYALARAGDDSNTQDMLNRIAQHGQAMAEQNDPSWLTIMLPVANAFVQHARGGFAQAAEQLGRFRSQLPLLGGTTIQQQWYDEILSDTRLKQGAFADA